MDTIFKKGDRVYDAILGWGEIKNLNNLSRYFEVLFDTGTIVYYCEDGSLYDNQNRNSFKPTLSFNQYQLNGFSQERPEILPQRGDVVWVRDDDDFNWEVSMFLEYDINETDGPYIASPNMIEGDHQCWKYMTTKNPYLK